jgi:SAM-dependent methyltransferase
MESSIAIDIFKKIIVTIIIIFCIYYINLLIIDKFTERKPRKIAEGFQGQNKNDSVYTWLENNQLYDSFYAEIYDQLASHGTRMTMQVEECLTRWKSISSSSMSVLDIGCGTGAATRVFAAKGVSKVCGLDFSEPMLTEAKNQLIKSKLDVNKAAKIEYRQGNMMSETACKPGEFTHASLFYFSIYYVEDKKKLFENIYSWLTPGGCLVVEVVNKYKFDPMLQASAPFLGFSLQKYTKERFNQSKISFNAFDYEGEFLLLEEGPKSEAAEFREIITFKKGGVVRRQKHHFWMPELKEIIKAADSAGFTYKGYKDMLPMGFEYSYMLFFERN